MQAYPSDLSGAGVRLEDADLVRRCRAGDETAFRRLLGKYRSRLIRVAANLLHDRMEAEDAAQETFLKAFSQLQRLRDDTAFSGFLYRICVRLCVDKLRLIRAEPQPFDAPAEIPRGSIETRLLVRQLLRRLPDDLRITLTLRELEGMSYEEVAEVTGVPIGTVRSRLHAARERFRKMWEFAMKEGAK